MTSFIKKYFLNSNIMQYKYSLYCRDWARVAHVIYYVFEINEDLCSTSQDDRDKSHDSLIVRRIESHLNEIYVSSIPVLSAINGSLAQ